MRQTKSLKRRFASLASPVVTPSLLAVLLLLPHRTAHDRPPRVIRAHGARGKTTRASERDGFIFGRDLRNSGRDDAATRGLEGRRRSMCVAFASRFIPRRPYCLLFLLYSRASLSRRCSHRRPRAARLWRQAAAPLPRRKANRARARSHFVHRLPRAVFRDDSAGRYLGRRDAARSLRGARLPQRRPADARPGE